MVLVDEIERHIKEFEKKAEEDWKLGRIFENEAIALARAAKTTFPWLRVKMKST